MNTTKYSESADYETRFKTAPANKLEQFVEYVLWECSTEFMATSGMPTNADVECWISWLESRLDVNSAEIQQALFSCKEYIKP